jgi:hypothetical protein
MGLPSVDSNQGEHEDTEASQIQDTASIEDVVLRRGHIALLVGHQMAWPMTMSLPAAMASQPAAP